MKKSFTVAILGCGNRGTVYAQNMVAQEPRKFTVVSVCDHNPQQLVKISQMMPLEEKNLFTDEEIFFQEKRADILIISTWDKDHVHQCIRAMELGYDILLEKPISDSAEEIDLLLKAQKKTGRKIVVCHVLRYSAGVNLLDKVLKTGVLGKLITIDQTERVRFWHYLQAYFKLHSLWEGKTFATILAKCCHDLDLIQHFAQSKCHSVSSVGGVAFFKRENAPEDATEYCLDCPHVDTCPYSAKRVYVDNWKAAGRPEFKWPWNKVSLKNPNTEEDLYNGIRNSVFGKCAFMLDADKDEHVVDHQLVQMAFKNGVVANLKMVFSANVGRRIALYGTLGEVVMDMYTDSVEVMPYGGEKQVLKISDHAFIADQHGGGDRGIVEELYGIMTGEITEYTSLEESVESHLIGIAAEKSRLSGGESVIVHE